MSTKSKVKKTTRKSPARRSPRAYKQNKKMCSPCRPIGLIVTIILGVAALVAVAFITIFSTIKTNGSYEFSLKTDAEKFAAEYTEVATDNVFVYRTADEIVSILEKGTGVVYLGFPECPWCQAYAKYLDEVAKKNGIEKIYYYNILTDRKDNTSTYQKLIEILDNRLQYDDEGNYRIYVPDAVFVVDGEIVGNDYESSKYTAGLKDPAEYWTEGRISDLKTRLGSYAQIVKNSHCETSCDK